MRKLRNCLSMFFTIPAALALATVILLLSLGGLVAGTGFRRTFDVLHGEFFDALKYAKVRLDMQRKRK